MQETEIVKKLKKLVIEALENKNTPIKLEHPADSKFGDYSTNVALGMAKELKLNPKDLASDLKSKIKTDDIIEKIEVAGAGFLNFYLKKEVLVEEAEAINYEIEFNNKVSLHGKGKKVVVEYSSPNIAKPFGIGHLRSTNIGQAIYNIYKMLGWDTIGDNHLGDWGTQFGKMITALKHWADKPIEEMTIADLEKLYVKFHNEAEKNNTLNDEAREWFARLEKGDLEAKEIWQKCVDISLGEFNRVYEMLGVRIDNAHGEAFYEGMLPEIVSDLKEKGLTKISDGALIVELPDMPPAMLLKADGATTYFTRDMATIKYRVDEWHPDLVVYEVGSEQILHFRQVFKAAELMGWVRPGQLYHLPHGLIRWASGKFSTRKGDTIHLIDVIDKAVEEAKKVAEASQVSKEMTQAEKDDMIQKVALAAVKFTDLSQDPKKDVIFDWETMMDVTGDSGPYLQYTYARGNSVLSKTEIVEQKNIESVPETMVSEEEALLKELYKFEEKIIESGERFNPGVMAEYLLAVARRYNEFYNKCRIIGQPEEVWRVFLTKTTTSVLKMGLHLLGIEVLEKM